MNLLQRAQAIADDRESGASELLARLLPLLEEALGEGRDTTADVARIVCGGQPIMAALWNACAAAVAESDTPGTFARRRDEMLRGPRALARAAAAALVDLLDTEPGRVVLTVSYSSAVIEVLLGAAAKRPLEVVCAEGRPRLEGRRLGARLAEAGVRVRVVTDAAVTSYLGNAQAFICGADALLPRGWINKVGTRAVAAASSMSGVPTWVIAVRDKIAGPDLERRLGQAVGAGAEVWGTPPPGVVVENRYFELTPIDLATLFLTDAGPIPPDGLAELARQRGRGRTAP